MTILLLWFPECVHHWNAGSGPQVKRLMWEPILQKMRAMSSITTEKSKHPASVTNRDWDLSQGTERQGISYWKELHTGGLLVTQLKFSPKHSAVFIWPFRLEQRNSLFPPGVNFKAGNRWEVHRRPPNLFFIGNLKASLQRSFQGQNC